MQNFFRLAILDTPDESPRDLWTRPSAVLVPSPKFTLPVRVPLEFL